MATDLQCLGVTNILTDHLSGPCTLLLQYIYPRKAILPGSYPSRLSLQSQSTTVQLLLRRYVVRIPSNFYRLSQAINQRSSFRNTIMLDLRDTYANGAAVAFKTE